MRTAGSTRRTVGAMRLAVVAGPDDHLEGWAEDASRAGADLLLMPGGATTADALRRVAMRHGFFLCTAVGDDAVLVRADGMMARQRPRPWPLHVFETPWGLLGAATGPDAEFPKAIRAQVEAGAWLILVPGLLPMPRDVTRRRIAVRARAMENRCFVASACGPAYSGIHGPVEALFPEDGILAQACHEAPRLLLADLEPAALDAVREIAPWPATPLPRPERAAWH